MKAMISTLSLALSLAVATPAFAQTAPTAAPTAADADAFIASVEKDLFDYTVEASQVNWVNSTYITRTPTRWRHGSTRSAPRRR